jgi:hypothetical protein
MHLKKERMNDACNNTNKQFTLEFGLHSDPPHSIPSSPSSSFFHPCFSAPRVRACDPQFFGVELDLESFPYTRARTRFRVLFFKDDAIAQVYLTCLKTRLETLQYQPYVAG